MTTKPVSGMKKRFITWFAPILSGVLLALAFPSFGFGWLAWGALIPLFSVMEEKPWRSGFAAGVVFFAAVLYWLNTVMVTYGQLPLVVSIVVYLLLVIYLAAYWGGACWCACRIKQRLNLPLILVLPIVWIVFEYLRTYLLTGFPWANIAYSQAPYLSLIQGADLAGVYLLVALLVLVNTTGALLLRAYVTKIVLPWRVVGLVAVLWSLNYGYGQWRLIQLQPTTGEPLRVALVQGNIEQSLKWDPSRLNETLETYRDLSAKAQSPDLIVWPESATPFFYQDGGGRAAKVHSIVASSQANLLFGSPAYKQLLDDNGKSSKRYRYLNSAYLLTKNNELVGRSDKVHLVPFGEYVPLANLLSFVDKLAQGIGDFVPGQNSPLPLNGHQVGILVCYEAIFPAVSRSLVRNGADLIVNITNDAWFGKSSAPWQHLAMTRFRAVENRVWLARCANTGVSALIDPLGRVVRQSHLFQAETVEGDVYFCNETSLYTRTGDSVPLLLSIVVFCWLWQCRKRSLSRC